MESSERKSTWNDSQLKAIYSDSRNLVVSAGAGSGKTAVMIERICRLIKEGHDIRRMLVSTFTNAAAADMKERLTEKLESGDCPEFTKSLKYLPTAEISTLHSWCSRVIKRWFFDRACSLGREFTILDEGETAAALSAIASSVIEEHRERGDADFTELYTALLNNRSTYKLREAMISVYEFAAAHPNPDEWLSTVPKHDDGFYRERLFKDNTEAIEKLREKTEQLCDMIKVNGHAPDYEKILLLIAAMRDYVRASFVTPQLKKDNATVEAIELHEEFKKCKNEYKSLMDERDELADKSETPEHYGSVRFSGTLCSLVRELKERYDAYKRDRSKADYSDLEHCTLALLSGDHAEDIAGAYDFVFVDEYQDINPLQEEILKKFKCNMFYVGDVKQSIYGFRMCSPEFFINKYEDFKLRHAASGSECEALELNTNYRSGKNVIGFINGVFGDIMGKNKGGGADYMPLVAGSDFDGLVRAFPIVEQEAEPLPVKIYSVKDDGDEGKHEAQINAVINEIKTLIGSNVKVSENKTRRLNYDDIVVLLRSVTSPFARMLEKRLIENSIPVTVTSTETRAEDFASVSEIISFMRVLDNSRDDVNLAAVLCSESFGGFSLDELGAIKSCGGSICDCVFNDSADRAYKIGSDLNNRLTEFARVIEKLRDRATALDVSSLAGKITSSFDCFNQALRVGGEREAAALDAYLEHLASLTENSMLHDYIKYIDRVGTPYIKADGGSGAVRIMTIHSSKGLEFTHVILPYLEKKFYLSDAYDKVICDPDEGVVMHSYDMADRTVKKSARYRCCSKKKVEELTSEEMRILYVAMTRAKCGLTLIAGTGGDSDAEDDGRKKIRYYDWLKRFMNRVEISPLEEAQDELTLDDGKERKEVSPRLDFSDDYKRAAVRVKASVSGVVHSADGEEQDVQDLSARFGGDDRAAERGSAYHKFMQWADLSGGDGEYDRLRELFPEEAKLVDRGKFTEALRDVSAYVGGAKYYREKSFVLNVPTSFLGETSDIDAKVLVQGVIDLLVVRKDGDGEYAEVLDYKTGGKLDRKAYSGQLGWYAYAVNKLLNLEVRGTYLYGIEMSEMIKVDATMPKAQKKQLFGQK